MTYQGPPGCYVAGLRQSVQTKVSPECHWVSSWEGWRCRLSKFLPVTRSCDCQLPAELYTRLLTTTHLSRGEYCKARDQPGQPGQVPAWPGPKTGQPGQVPRLANQARSQPPWPAWRGAIRGVLAAKMAPLRRGEHRGGESYMEQGKEGWFVERTEDEDSSLRRSISRRWAGT